VTGRSVTAGVSIVGALGQREEHHDDRRRRRSVGELVGKVLADEHADVLRQAVVWLAEQLWRSR
jgi:hypothetical protein